MGEMITLKIHKSGSNKEAITRKNSLHKKRCTQKLLLQKPILNYFNFKISKTGNKSEINYKPDRGNGSTSGEIPLIPCRPTVTHSH